LFAFAQRRERRERWGETPGEPFFITDYTDLRLRVERLSAGIAGKSWRQAAAAMQPEGCFSPAVLFLRDHKGPNRS
jgi:hypothetical protein